MLVLPSRTQRQKILENMPLQETYIRKHWVNFYRGKELARVSPYLHIHTYKDRVLLYHSQSFKKILGGMKLKAFYEELKKLDSFNHSFAWSKARAIGDPNLVIDEFVERGFFQQLSDALSGQKCHFSPSPMKKFTFNSFFLSLQNQTIPHCHYRYEVHPDREKLMDISTIKKALDLFLCKSYQEQKIIIIISSSGIRGWKKVLGEALETIRTIESRKKPGTGKFRKILLTQAHLADTSLLQIIESFRMEVHLICWEKDSIKKNEEREVAIRAFNLYKGKVPAITPVITLGKYNKDTIINYLDYFVKRTNIEFLRIQLDPDGEFDDFNPEDMAGLYFFVFKWLRDRKLVETNIGRIIVAFISQVPAIPGCGIYSGQISISPSGTVGSCPHLLSAGCDTIGMLSDVDIEGKIIRYFKDAGATHPVHKEDCQSCSALGLCAGGCALGSFMRYGDHRKRDSFHCRFMKSLVRRLLDDLIIAQKEE